MVNDKGRRKQYYLSLTHVIPVAFINNKLVTSADTSSMQHQNCRVIISNTETER